AAYLARQRDIQQSVVVWDERMTLDGRLGALGVTLAAPAKPAAYYAVVWTPESRLIGPTKLWTEFKKTYPSAPPAWSFQHASPGRWIEIFRIPNPESSVRGSPPGLLVSKETPGR